MFFSRSCPGCGIGRPVLRQLFCVRCNSVVQPVGPISGLSDLMGGGALFHYEGSVRRAIVVAKSGARPDVFRIAAPELAKLAALVTSGYEPPTLVTWVPASKRGRSARGFDQGRIMARVIGQHLNVPARRLLAGEGGSQLGRGRAERLAADRFRARGAVSGSVVLVDDVITTGASMVSAATALYSAGASSVFGVAIAWAATTEELAAGRPLAGAQISGPFAPA